MQQNALQMVPAMVPLPDGVAQREGKGSDRAIFVAAEAKCVREVPEGVVEVYLVDDMEIIGNRTNIERRIINGYRDQKETDTKTNPCLYRRQISHDSGSGL
jgi:hypothetical protein